MSSSSAELQTPCFATQRAVAEARPRPLFGQLQYSSKFHSVPAAQCLFSRVPPPLSAASTTLSESHAIHFPSKGLENRVPFAPPLVSAGYPRFPRGSRSWSDWAKGGADCDQTEQVRAGVQGSRDRFVSVLRGPHDRRCGPRAGDRHQTFRKRVRQDEADRASGMTG